MRTLSHRFLIRLIGVAGSLFAVAPGFAQNGDTSSSGDDWFKSIFSVSGEYVAEETYVGEASVEHGHQVVNDYDEHDTLLRVVLTPRTEIGVLRLGLEWERFSFGFPDRVPLPNTLQAGALVVGLDTQISDSILLRFEAQPGFYGTTDFASNNFSVPFIVGGTYIYSPALQIVLGIAVDVEREYPVIPGGGIRWKIARQWVLNAVLPAPRLEYAATKDLTLYAGGVFKETNFRTADNFGTMKGNTKFNDAVLTYSEVRAGVGADWKIASFATLSAEVGYQPYRSFDYYRADVRFHENGSAPYGMLSIHGAF